MGADDSADRIHELMASLGAVLGKFGGRSQGIVLTVDIPLRYRDIAVRHHNSFVKLALAEAMNRHHKNVIPEHFKATARDKYHYRERNTAYKKAKMKRYGSRTDLVKTGESKEFMTHNRTITVAGAAEGGKTPIKATITMRFPFKGGTGRQRYKQDSAGGVGIDQMIKEVQAMTDDDRRKIADDFWTLYCHELKKFRGRRQRTRTTNFSGSRPAAWGEL